MPDGNAEEVGVLPDPQILGVGLNRTSLQISARTIFSVESNTSCAKEDCKPERRHYVHQSMLMRNWLTNQMLLLRQLQLQPATPTTPRRLRCHAAQQHKRHHYESFAPGGPCHHLQSTKAVNLSLSQLQKQTGNFENSRITIRHGQQRTLCF